jgi:tripartite-type tricarboxylate transporter receptor subunit TctC
MTGAAEVISPGLPMIDGAEQSDIPEEGMNALRCAMRSSGKQTEFSKLMVRGLLLGSVLSTLPLASWAAESAFPTRPIRLIVPLAPGGGVDITARALAQRLTAIWGQNVVVDNRAGGTGAIGLEIASKSAPDGHTLTFATGTHTARPATQLKLPYDLVKDFAPITQVTRQSYVLVVNPAVPAKSIQELIALAREKPGSLTYGSAGQGSLQHFSGALLATITKTNMLHVAYKGGGPALADVLAGHISMVFATPLESVPHIKGGRLRALAVTGAKRSPVMPDLPAVVEAGVPGYEVTNWYGILAPAATPKPIVVALNRGIVEAVKSPELTERFRRDGVEPIGSTSEEFRTHILAEIQKWRSLVAAAGIKPE